MVAPSENHANLQLLVQIRDGSDKSTHWAYPTSPVRIGRNALNDLAIDAPYVSQWHAVVQFDANGAIYLDLGSTNGTKVKGQRLRKSNPVQANAATVFHVGPLELTFSVGAPGEQFRPAVRAWSARVTHQENSDSPFLAGNNGERTMMLSTDAGAKASHRPAAGVRAPTPEPDEDYQATQQVPDSAGAFVQQANRIRALITELQAPYREWRSAWTNLYNAIDRAATSLPPDVRKQFLDTLQRELAALPNEAQFRTLLTRQQVTLHGAAGMKESALQAMEALAKHILPRDQALSEPWHLGLFADRLVSVLGAFGDSLVAQRRGYAQIGEDLALPLHRGEHGDSPLDSAKDVRSVLGYLLDLTVDGSQPLGEMQASYADLMIHQVALLNGLMEGVRGVLQRIGPEQIAREADQTVNQSPLRKALSGVWPFRQVARWNRFTQQYRELTEDENALQTAVFGREFARAYAQVTGESVQDGPHRLESGTGSRRSRD